MFYTLSQDMLSRLIMPLGNMKDKEDVRNYAEKIGLSMAKKKDSQEICFIQDNDYCSFIERNVKAGFESGNFIDIDGNVLGQHKGIPFYTVGQRKGLGLSLGKPMYVKDIVLDGNMIMLTDNSELFTTELLAEKVNSVKYEKIPEDRVLKIKTRYTAKEAEGRIKNLKNGNLEIKFLKPQRAVTPGQSVVLYEGDDLIGGGIIVKTAG